MGQDSIYLDHNATTAMAPEVVDAMLPFMRSLAGNPSSRHADGRRARQTVDHACERIAGALDAGDAEIIFTSGATEANNLAILDLRRRSPGVISILSTEHPSSKGPADRLREEGSAVESWPVDDQGRARTPPANTASAIMQWANSETGVIQDLPKIRELLPTAAFLHVDAVQAVGKVPVSFRDSGATTMVLSGHKIHGPAGIGMLLARRHAVPTPIFHGGPQQEGIRPGSEPVALIVGLATAIESAARNIEKHQETMRRQRDRFEEELLRRLRDVIINGDSRNRLPNTSNLSFLGVRSEALLLSLDLDGVRASAGSACASGSIEPSPVLLAMGLPKARVDSAVRFSLGRFTTDDEVDQASDRVVRAVERLRQTMATD